MVSRNLMLCLGIATAIVLLFAYVSLGSASDDARKGTSEIGRR